MSEKKIGIDTAAQNERFNALLLESRLNQAPANSPDEYRMGQLAVQFIQATEGSADQEAIRNEMANLSIQMANDPISKVWEGGERREHGPDWQLAKELLAASLERDRLGVAPPPAMSAVSGNPVPTGEIGERMREILRQSLDQSREDCNAARAAQNGDHA